MPLHTTLPRFSCSGSNRQRVIFAGISALILTVGLARFAYTPMLPIMRNDAGLSSLAGGWLATLNYLGYIFGVLTAATIGSLRQKFYMYRCGLIVAVLSTAGMGLAQDMFLWAVLRFISGFSSTAGLLLASGLVLNWLIRHDHKPELGLHFAGIGLGIIVSGWAVAAMAGSLSWKAQWMSLGLLGVAFFLPAWFWLPAPEGLPPQTVKAAPQPPSRCWMNLLVAAYFCGGVGYVISATFTVAMLEQLPLLTGKGMWVWVMVGLAATPSCFLWDRLANAVGRRHSPLHGRQ